MLSQQGPLAAGNSGHLSSDCQAVDARIAFWCDRKPEFLLGKARGLIWANPQAGESAYIRAALVRPRFSQLLDIAAEFGLKRVRQEWEILETERRPEVARAHRIVERILRHIEEGFDRIAP